MLDVRNDFPAFASGAGHFLDSAASSLKPKVVLEAMHEFAGSLYANVHRGAYRLSTQSTELYEEELREGRSDDLREELRAVERAEERLASGAYGLSVESGVPIPDERLEAEPTAERTVEEEERWERGRARHGGR